MKKSKIARKLAIKRGIKFVNVPLARMSPSDMRGFPMVAADALLHMDWDHLPKADAEVQASAYNMIRDREIGEHVLGKGK